MITLLSICDALNDDNKSEYVPSTSFVLTSLPGSGTSDENDKDGRARELVIDCLECYICNFDASTLYLVIDVDRLLN